MLIKFSPFCNKTINANNKTRRCNKARFLLNTLKKTPSSGKSLIRITQVGGVGVSAYLSLTGRRRGGRLFEAERLLTFSAFRIGAYSKWAQIRVWALIRINTVRRHACIFHVFFS